MSQDIRLQQQQQQQQKSDERNYHRRDGTVPKIGVEHDTEWPHHLQNAKKRPYYDIELRYTEGRSKYLSAAVYFYTNQLNLTHKFSPC